MGKVFLDYDKHYEGKDLYAMKENNGRRGLIQIGKLGMLLLWDSDN